jgi:hypothetical protein
MEKFWKSLDLRRGSSLDVLSQKINQQHGLKVSSWARQNDFRSAC